jgi:hypothetical protein
MRLALTCELPLRKFDEFWVGICVSRSRSRSSSSSSELRPLSSLELESVFLPPCLLRVREMRRPPLVVVLSRFSLSGLGG